MKPSPLPATDKLQSYVSELVLHFTSVMSNNYERLRAENHAEALHDMRVATRRLRETISLFEPLLPTGKVKKVVTRVKKVTKALGLPREIDVNLELIRSLQPSGGLVARAACEHFNSILEREQLRTRKKMLQALERIGFKSLREELTQFAEAATSSPFRPHLLFEEHQAAMRENFLKLIPRILEDKAAPVLNFELSASSLEDDRTLHQLRIATKKLRYTFEIAKPLISIPCDELAKACRTLQDDIGAQHDYCVLINLLKSRQIELADRNLTLLADGSRQLIEDLSDLKNHCRAKIEIAFASVREKLLKELPGFRPISEGEIPADTTEGTPQAV